MLHSREPTGESSPSLRTFANIRIHCSPAEAGAQEREALRFLCPGDETLPCGVLGPGLRAPSKYYFDGNALRRGTTMKQINVYPMVIMLIAIILLVIWLRPH